MMKEENKNLILILLVLALFTGMAIEISEGSTVFGALLFIFAIILLATISFKRLGDPKILKKSKIYFLTGFLIISADLIYNFESGGDLGTLDIMTIFLGLSLIGSYFQDPQINRISRFGVYISSVFILLFLIFYSMFAAFNIDFLHKFDHYCILLPTVAILKMTGIPLEVVTIETVKINGIEEMLVVIGGPCSGLYSMFLLIGIVFGYSRIEKMNSSKTLKMLGFCVVIAYISNLFRVIALYLTAFFYGSETMMIVHTHLGWIIFAVIAIILMYLIEPR